MGSGDFGVPSGDRLFVAPVLVLHYVLEHRYLPPREFVDAVLKAPPPRSSRYQWRVRRFQGLSISQDDEQRIADAIRAWVSRAR
jgi:hypothetical protein